MVLTQQEDDEGSPPEEKRDFQELQNALRRIIVSFLQYPQVKSIMLWEIKLNGYT